jgi:hypothetical protein
MGSIALRAFFSRVEKLSDDINSRLFLMNKKGLMQLPCVAGSGGHHPGSVPGHQEAHGTLSGQDKLIFVFELE